MDKVIDYIYKLSFMENGKEVVFYIGRSIDMDRRLYEHKNAAKNYKPGDEWVYEFASTLNKCNIEWNMHLVQECGDGTEHFEDYYINKFKLEGHPLQNMKAGDDEPWMGKAYLSPEHFVMVRQKTIDALEKQKKIKAVKVKKQYSGDPERTLYSFEKPHEKFISPAMKAMLAKRRK